MNTWLRFGIALLLSAWLIHTTNVIKKLNERVEYLECRERVRDPDGLGEDPDLETKCVGVVGYGERYWLEFEPVNNKMKP